MRSFVRLARASSATDKADAIAEGALERFAAQSVTVLLFFDDAVTAASRPHDQVPFALRDNSAELRRLFFHALTRMGGGAPVFADRTAQRPLVPFSNTAGKHDCVFVPLMAGPRPIGVVVLRVDAPPDESALGELSTFAELVVRLLEMSREVAIARRQSRDSQLLAMVNERLHKSLDRRDVLFGIVEGVRAAFDADRCIVYERAGEDHVRVAAAAAQGSPSSVATGRLPIDGDLRKALGGLTVRRGDVEGSAAYGATARSALIVPFVVEGQVEDALVLAFDRPEAVGDADVAAARSLAFHVGLALSNARLYERERARRAQAESLERVVRILRDTQYVDEVLLVFAVTVSHELPVDCAAFAIDGEALVQRASRVRDVRGSNFGDRFERAAFEPFLAVDEPSDASLLPRDVRHALFERNGGIVVPLRLDGVVWGMFVVRAAQGELTWSAGERATFFRTLGSHLEIALANARAYEREMRRGQERETLAEAARTILSHTALGPLAEVMCRLAASLVHANNACLLRWNGSEYAAIGKSGEDTDALIEASGFDLRSRVERLVASDDRRVQRLIDGPGYAMIPLVQASAESGGVSVDAFLLVGVGSTRVNREQLRLLQELGALLALALRNIELYEEVLRANQALRESSEFKDDLLAMLAHDFKGPLTVILGYCELLLEEDSPHHEEIQTVFAQTQRLVRLSDDALVLAQTQSEGFSLARTVTDLGAFITECVNAIAASNPRVAVEIPQQPVPVELDPQRFRHVIDNLLSNALKYSDGETRVRVHVEGERAFIDVSDCGIGIPADEVAGLFTRFGRASNARRLGIAGSGIGLYVARKIVGVHRGTLTVRSVEDEGSTFTISLPLAG